MLTDVFLHGDEVVNVGAAHGQDILVQVKDKTTARRADVQQLLGLINTFSLLSVFKRPMG